MPDKRYQVFVSSTFHDLERERQEVMHALLELDCMPAGMELFPAANESQWNLIKKVIDDCDYYILIVAGTRPECIKLAPVVRELAQRRAFGGILVNSGQHAEAVRRTFAGQLMSGA